MSQHVFREKRSAFNLKANSKCLVFEKGIRMCGMRFDRPAALNTRNNSNRWFDKPMATNRLLSALNLASEIYYYYPTTTKLAVNCASWSF